MGMVGSHDPELGPDRTRPDQARVVGTDGGRWHWGRGPGESAGPWCRRSFSKWFQK